MLIHAGYEISYACPHPTPMILTLSVHPSRINDLVSLDRALFNPPIAANTYHDSFGNFCHVIEAPAGKLTMRTDFVIRDSGLPDPVLPGTAQHPIETLPADTLSFLLPSRYCESDRLADEAWRLFGSGPQGWERVQAVVDFVHNHIAFDYLSARATRTAAEAYGERIGVCRDFAHLAVAFCRALNIPTTTPTT